MSSIRIHSHPSLPAPVVHAGFSAAQSKSHVLAGVQDAYWSDDEGEDAECPLCLEEMDISDLNFKPCICGYQICRFCWHHIKENLNGRCPACRRVYTDDAVEFKPIAKDDHKRLTQQKKQRERERKELDALGRRQLANVRVVQRNVVYVVGIGPRFAKEELIPTLRSSDYFGQYGKITKILLVKRTPSGGGPPVVGLYITYHRREDAARAISAVDGTASPGGGREVMRASHGTTKYCMAFLRGVSCSDHGCMNLHEWGDEKDCFTKEDLTTLKHTMKDTENRSRAAAANRKGDESEGLPRAASWAHKGGSSSVTPALHNNTNVTTHSISSSVPSRPARRGGTRQSRNTPSTSASDSRSSGRVHSDRKGSSTTGAVKTPSQASSSRPPTPAALLPQRPATPADVKALKQKESRSSSLPSRSSTPSVAVESDLGSGPLDLVPSSPDPRPKSAESIQSPTPSAPPGIPAVPPGLPAPSRLSRAETSSPQTPLLASQSSYQMSTAARALLDDVKARRGTVLPATQISPFPDFDRTLQTLAGGEGGFGGFSFNLDPKLAGDDTDVTTVPGFEIEAGVPFQGTFVDAFPALRPPSQPSSGTGFMPPPGLAYPNRPIYDPSQARAPVSPLERQVTGSSNYIGSFNPFSENSEDAAGSPSRKTQHSPMDDDRKLSRFGFARGRQGSTAASSPLHVSSPLSTSDSHTSFYNSTEFASPSHWPTQGRLQQQQSEYAYAPSGPGSAMGSPDVQQAQAYSQHQGRFQPFDSGVSEAQLRDLIQSSRDRAASASLHNTPAESQGPQFKYTQNQPFSDPAIMSASFGSPMPLVPDARYMGPSALDGLPSQQASYGPPPGLSFPPGISPSPSHGHGSVNLEASQSNGSVHVSTPGSPVSSPYLSSSDFPALTALSNTGGAEEHPSMTESVSQPLDDKAQAKAERKAAKKAAAAEKAAERQKIAQEKAAAKAVEKAKIAAEKAVEKEKAAALKAEQQKVALEKAEKEKAEDRLAKERAMQVEQEKAAQAEKEKAAMAKEKATSYKQATPGSSKGKVAQKASKQPEERGSAASPLPARSNPKQPPSKTSPPTQSSGSFAQVPLLSKMPKKNKPATKPIRIPSKEEEIIAEEASTIPSDAASEAPQIPEVREAGTTFSSSNNSRMQSSERYTIKPTSISDFFDEINIQHPHMDLSSHPFFDLYKINPAAKMPLEYGPLVHALSALSVGGGSFANNMPSGSIDNAVSSFQQLLETLTQTISDLLRLLPRTTWDDSSSFDGVLRDMLKGDDFLDDGGDDAPGKEDEVAALTLALERRARWMEVQLSKLEELHRDINTAAVRAVLSFNDNGWDRHGFMPRIGNTLRRFDNIGVVEADGSSRPMTADELEKKLTVAKEAAVFAEAEVRETMDRMQSYRPVDLEF